ncbi:Protein of unknown function [Gryllus bimaculatus]|nr:Protein of unknown function [Gryllus bimaculatus]
MQFKINFQFFLTGYGNSVHNMDPLMFAPPTGAWYGVSSTNYSPTPGGFFGWVPQTPSYQTISSNSAFMTRMPPPYPDNNIYKNYPPPPYSDSHLM